ncbi:MAG: NAD(P)H-hydrate epimerase, partial [Nitrospirales bacterium]
MKIVTAAQMQELDRRTIEEAGVRGATLMNRAGTGVVSTLEAIFGSPRGKTISIFCGKGNNGGDGFVVARLLRRKHATVHVCLLGNPAELKGDAKLMYTRFTKSSPGSKVQVNPSDKTIWAMLGTSNVVVD